jgi:predicted phage terminase large subunit-like protein
MESIKIDMKYLDKQCEMFYRTNSRFKVIHKGRRLGLTHGMMLYAIERCLRCENPIGEKILWVDTTYANMVRYIIRYGFPKLKQFPKSYYEWNKTNNILLIKSDECESFIDFRSADRPENFEGFGYTLVLLNEAGIILKNPNLWLETIRPMMLDYKAEAIIGGTPKGKRYKGKEHLFYTLSKKGKVRGEFEISYEGKARRENWITLNYSSYDNEDIDDAEVDELASEISPMLREQEIHGKFVDVATDRIIKREWFQVTGFINPEENRKYILQSWDTAFKKNEENDYSVCTTWEIYQNQYRLIDVFRERLEFPELKKKVVELNEKFKPNEIIIEDKASGISLLQELERNTVLPIIPIKTGSKDKVERVHSITPLIESGNVVLYSLMEFDLNLFLDECEDFPNGEFDDMVDSMSQALEHLRNSIKVEMPRPIVKKYRKKKIY